MTHDSSAMAPSASSSSSERSLALLALVASEGRALSLAELSARLGLPKASAHRICAQLQEGGWLMRDADERSFSVGPALRRLALDTLNNGVVRGLRHEVLADLVAKIGETCNFTTLDGATVIYLDRVEAPWPWRLTLDVGAHVPLHCTASGKLFLASMAAARRDALIERLRLEPLTPTTITARDTLRAECEAIAARGYSTDREEFIAGLNAAAVPVKDAQGQTRAAIAIHAPSARMSIDDAIARLPALQAAAARMAELL
ncbi:MAG: IclR family transcriptional regulator [Burkholderiaceae bacterium]|nr:MAG: IclR family transcriptional regulator [Burkholderiaceae bacterium]